MASSTGPDGMDKMITFLAKRDGIDKLVKTFQYVFKLGAWTADAHDAGLAKRMRLFETSCGLSRKAFRTGRFLTGINALRKTKYPNKLNMSLAIVGNAGMVVYFVFDHLTWAASVGLLDPSFAKFTGFTSAFGEQVFYTAFIMLDLMEIANGLREEKRLLTKLRILKEEHEGSTETLGTTAGPGKEPTEEMKKVAKALTAVRMQRLMRVLSVSAQVADWIIALQSTKGGPVWTHPLLLGVCGLVSAWAGWYNTWP